MLRDLEVMLPICAQETAATVKSQDQRFFSARPSLCNAASGGSGRRCCLLVLELVKHAGLDPKAWVGGRLKP